jgi:hypothetical protein
MPLCPLRTGSGARGLFNFPAMESGSNHDPGCDIRLTGFRDFQHACYLKQENVYEEERG